jgi:hypothetical protein
MPAEPRACSEIGTNGRADARRKILLTAMPDASKVSAQSPDN